MLILAIPLSMLIGAYFMSAALDRLTAEVAETKGVAASATAALLAVPGLIRDAVAAALANAQPVDEALNALADDLDASIAPLSLAIQQNPVPTDPDHVEPGAGNDSTTAPVAVVSEALGHTDGTGADTVIVTDHPNGDVLVTTVTSDGEVPAGSITVDPTTGVPTAADDGGVTLGETTIANEGAISAATVAADDASAVVSGVVEQDA